MGLLMRDGAETHTDHTGVGECVTVKSDSLSHPAERTIRGLDSATTSREFCKSNHILI